MKKRLSYLNSAFLLFAAISSNPCNSLNINTTDSFLSSNGANRPTEISYYLVHGTTLPKPSSGIVVGGANLNAGSRSPTEYEVSLNDPGLTQSDFPLSFHILVFHDKEKILSCPYPLTSEGKFSTFSSMDDLTNFNNSTLTFVGLKCP